MEPRAFRQEMPPYRPQEVHDLSHSCKSNQSSEKYGSLVESSNRHHRDRVNSMDKSVNSPSGMYSSSSIHGKNYNKSQLASNSGIGSIGRRHHGCSASLSEANVREMYGVMLPESNKGSLARERLTSAPPISNVTRQKSLDVSERNRDRDRANVLAREVDSARTTSTSLNNSLDGKCLSLFSIR